jgi:hypothetical protein
LNMIDEYIHIEEDERKREECSKKVLRGLFERYTDLVKIVDACSLDPQRARKANAETRDAVFVKLDCYIKSLYAMELIPWKSFGEVSKKKSTIWTRLAQIQQSSIGLKLLRMHYL